MEKVITIEVYASSDELDTAVAECVDYRNLVMEQVRCGKFDIIKVEKDNG